MYVFCVPGDSPFGLERWGKGLGEHPPPHAPPFFFSLHHHRSTAVSEVRSLPSLVGDSNMSPI